MTSPVTHYAKSGDVHIAYQITGSGPLDLVMVPGFVSHLELTWDDPEALVSSTVKDLVAGAGIEFEDIGTHALKGVPGEWRLFSVRG